LSLDKVILAEITEDGLARIDLETFLALAKEVRQSLAYCLSRNLSCDTLVEALHTVARSLASLRLSKTLSKPGEVPGGEHSIDSEFLKELVAELLTYYLAITLALVDHDMRIPVKFGEDVAIGSRRYRANSVVLLDLGRALALRRAGARVDLLIPRDAAEFIPRD
jgi:hypothetical protein